METKNSRPIRFGIMCNNYVFPKWQADAIQKLMDMDGVEPVLLIFDKDFNNGITHFKNLLPFFKFKHLLWYIYYFFIVKLFCKADSKTRLYQKLKHVDKISCRTIKKGKYANYFKEEDVARIKKRELDFVLRFGFGIIKGEILEAAKFGIWSFHHDDESKYRGGPPAFWEIVNNDTITAGMLQKIGEELDQGIVLKKGYFKTIEFSYIKNREQCFLESSEWPMLVVKDIRNGTAAYFQNNFKKSSTPLYSYPDNLQMLKFQFKVFFKSLITKFSNVFFITQWTIGVVEAPMADFLKIDNKKDFSPTVHWLKGHGKKSFYADPFPVYHDGDIYIIFEELKYREGKGFIAAVKFDGKSFIDYQEIIKLPFHMSYPYPIRYNEEYYFLPEICESGAVNLYKANKFLGDWQKKKVVIPQMAGVDSSIVEYRGKWWLFGTEEKDGSSYKLKIWYADDLFGNWVPHAANPVKIDIRSSRPAGKLFIHEGELYRPSQNYSEKNQGSITITKIIKLTTKEFEEEVISEVYPFKNSIYNEAIHTINSAGNRTIIDSRRTFFALGSVAGVLYSMQIIKNKFRQILKMKM